MLNKNVEKALNEQIERESFSSNLYLAMASWADTNGYPGSAEFLYVQAEEERLHMLKIFRFINNREGKAVVPALKQPEHQFNSIKAVFQEVLGHEKFISDSINKLVGICIDERDFTTVNFLQWYVNEQIEEENTARTIVDRLNLLGDDKVQLYMFDRDLKTVRQSATSAVNNA